MISHLAQEEQWNEDRIKNLPAEDDRFEFKENINLDSIAKAVCAFANSFGGTLFLGVKDKTHEIIGIPKKFPIGSRSNTVEWLEREIPALLSFRFGSFRVRSVKLGQKTQSIIEKDKFIVSVDVFDSETAPYQVALKGKYEHRYFYRENSSSVLAPHSHLAYLWLRNSNDKTRVIQFLITNFLTPLIEFVETLDKEFTELRFYHINYNSNGDDYINLNLNSWIMLESKLNTLAAEQFLRQEDSVKLGSSARKLSALVKDFELLVKICSETAFSETRVDIRELNAAVKRKWEGDLEEFSKIASRILTYVIFDLKSSWNVPNAEGSVTEYFKKNILKSINKLPFFKSKKNEMKKSRKEILETTNEVLEKAKILRHELCLRYNAIYSDVEEKSYLVSGQPFREY